MPVQAIYKFVSQGDDRRIVAGRLESGAVAVGDKVLFSPSNKTGVIQTIEGFNTAPRTRVEAGWSTGFTLREEIYVTPGEIMSHEKDAPLVSTRFRANLIWLGKKPFQEGRDYKLKIHTQSVPVHIHKINKVIDASKTDSSLEKKEVSRHEVAEVVLETQKPVAFDLVGDCDVTGRFVIVDGYDIAGGGILVSAEKDDQEERREEARQRDIHWIAGGVSIAERARKFGHQPALVMFVGKAGVGKHVAAAAVEKALFDQGRSTYLLDGTNVLLGVDQDLVWVQSTQQELVRRFAEVAHILLHAGHIVVSTTNTIGLADFAAVQALIPDFSTLVIDIDPAGTSLSPCHERLTGRETSADIVTRVLALLAQNRILNSLDFSHA
jgi:bifunctional enzyme CysN/CysC